ncbi:HNH endonuclease family protein [Mangrovicoccus algicola]|uniref:HNH endonuclease n=1 Tax=Mangrovicoccus algicola TaxID=2771008 RepID=A0A8J6YZQ4_9RHOB|nr:HNH endonuclease family protein [Mangrovicoccus algicola]MBE3640570.1 HNH endonuclease [Mangrovicoccus algicola]
MGRAALLLMLGLGFCEGPEIPDYDRGAFSGWIDEDGDCQRTRAELMIARSSGPVTLSADGCRAIRGTWRDPYSGEVHSEAEEVQIDHLVPLKWAWMHGAHGWSAAERDRFALDPDNLRIVGGGLNAAKGAKDPLDWLPPRAAAQCGYLRGFEGIVARYRLEVDAAWAEAMSRTRLRVCSGDGAA